MNNELASSMAERDGPDLCGWTWCVSNMLGIPWARYSRLALTSWLAGV
jgi:hypothetical protein